MVRLAIVIVALLAVPAGAFERPRPMGMYVAASQTSFALLESRVDVTVRGPIVEAVVLQRYQNPTDHATEATYIFPLPVDAAVSGMSIEVGTRTIRAGIEKREEAQRRYEAAIAAGVHASVLDEERPDIFTQTVAAIPPHGIVEVSLRYDTVARYQAGTWELVVPMVVAPRYVPGTASGRPTTGTGHAPDTDRAPDASRITPAGTPGAGGSTAVALHFIDVPSDVTCPTHEITVANGDAALSDPHSDHDAIIRWRAPAPQAGWVEKDADGGYAAVVVEGPRAQPKSSPVRMVLAVDRSATMRGDADLVEHPIVRTLLGSLDGGDRIRLVGEASEPGRAPVARGSERAEGNATAPWTTPADALKTLERVWSLQPGTFDLTRVLATLRTDGAPVVLVTDGLVGDDRAAIAAAKKLGVPIHVIGVGPSPARGLLAQLAGSTGGTLRFAIPGDDLAQLVKNLTSDLATPPAAVAVNWGQLAASDVEPAVLPRVGAGAAMIAVAKVRRVQQANARVGGAVFAFEALPGERGVTGATTSHGPLARRWARDRLGDMLATGADRNAVTNHALAYGLVSPFTSLVAIGTDVVVQGGVKHSVAIPVSVPAGMHWDNVKQAITVDQPPSAVLQDTTSNRGLSTTGGTVGPAAQPPPAAPTPGAAATPPKHPKTVDDEDESKQKKRSTAKKDANEEGADADADEKPARKAEEAPEPAPMESVASLDRFAGEEVIVTGSEIVESGRAFRITGALGGGLAFDHGSSGLFSLDLRLETNRRTLLGLEGALWLVGGNDAQGRVLVTLGRRGIAHRLELGIGLGAHFGDGAGPATSLRLRVPIVPHVGGYLRYDNAFLVTRPETEVEHALTLGLELSY